MMKRRALIWIGIAMAVPMLLVGGCIVASRDEPPPEDGDLAVRRLEVPEDENGFRWFARIEDFEGAEVKAETGGTGGGEEEEEEDEFFGSPFTEGWDSKAARKLIEKNRFLLGAFDSSLRSPRFQVPETTSYSDPVKHLPAIRDAAHAALCRAALRFEDGDEAAALDGALEMIRFGRRIQGGQGTVIHYLLGVACESIGLNLLRNLVQRATLPDEDILRRLESLAAPVDEHDGLAHAYKLEHRLMSTMIERMHTGDEFDDAWDHRTKQLWKRLPFLRGLLLKPNQCRRLSAEHFRLLVNYRAPWRDPKQPLGPGGKLPQLPTAWWPPTNLAGKGILGFLLPTLDRALGEMGKIHALRTTPVVFFALRRHEREMGQLPGALNQLVPRYLDRVPIDPFDAKPVKYSREKRIVYSVGPDGVDQGGNADEGGVTQRADDPTWKIEF